MRLGIMQPYFMPYIGYFSLIKHTDLFILFDTVQFIRHGWIERNRILKQNDGWQYIKIPLIKENGRETIIRDVKINNSENWKDKMLSQLQHYKKIAPNYYKVIDLLKCIFAADYSNIVSLNKVALEKTCDFLGISTQIDVLSEMDLSIEQAKAPDEWALNICKVIDGVDEYWNPIGGLSFFERRKYEQAGIKICFQEMKLDEYDQKRSNFELGLSMIDVMMFNSLESINDMLDKYELK